MKRLFPMLLLLSLLLAAPTFAQGTFDYTSPTQVIGVTSTTVTVFAIPFGIKVLDCPSTGILGKFCDEVAVGDTAGFEGDLPSDLQVAEIDQGFAYPTPGWEIPDGCIDSISSIGKYTIWDVDDNSGRNVDVWCDPDKGLLGHFCSVLAVGDCTQFQGGFFASDHDHPGERTVIVIRATE